MSQAESPAVSTVSAPRKTSFRKRFHAWWEGYDLEAEAERAAEAERRARDAEIAEAEAFRLWDDSHLELLQAVWGERQIWPGSQAAVCQLVKPFGLNPAMSLLELGAGLGEPARAMAETFGVWVTAMEAETSLAARGMKLSEAAGLGKKAPVFRFEPETYAIKPRSFDCVFSREFLYRVADKNRLIDEIDLGLKEGGQFLFTDFMVREGGAQSSNLAEWREAEPQDVYPWSVERYSKILTDRGFEVRITEDQTAPFCRSVLATWADFMAQLKKTPGRFREEALVHEVELWTKRMQALESGALKLYRIYARKPSGNNFMVEY